MKIVRFRNGKKQVYILPEESRQRIIKALRTRKISDKVRKNACLINKGKFAEKHPCWKEVKKRSLYGAIRSLYKYKIWRDNIYIRDDYTCVLCKKRGGNLAVDHYPKMFVDMLNENNIFIIDEALNCKELWEAGGRTLCLKCHRKTFNWGRNFHAKRLSERKCESTMR